MIVLHEDSVDAELAKTLGVVGLHKESPLVGEDPRFEDQDARK